MLRLPMRHTSFRSFPRLSTATSSSSLRRIPPSTSNPTPLPLPRLISTCLFPRSRPSHSITFSHTFPRPSRSPRGRPFSSSAKRGYQYGGNQYRRFNDPRREPLFIRLVKDAKPHHFVIIGLGISGLYIYNTDTVEVRPRLLTPRDRQRHLRQWG
ncbi:hypothetical protein BDV41DRAFT_541101 [Aspergillus transmontanensis]|uniref:Uncharacterized protein n=1 Tax=Aspergillus transmontanensis TaxID=1034304 RepID=A0A5N6VTB9_9EURO|nr:hypothetical protein BDV41DRAFT_541101 [Aspergillus transmontanensis]